MSQRSTRKQYGDRNSSFQFGKSKNEASRNKKKSKEKHEKATNAIRAAAVAQRKRRNKKTDSALPVGKCNLLLYSRLRFIMFPMLLLGQLPFLFFNRKKKGILIRLRLTYPFLWISMIVCVLNWVLFIWIGAGMYLVSQDNSKLTKENQKKSIEFDMADRFWLGYVIFWMMLLHIAISSTEFVVKSLQVTNFIKDLIQVAETTKMDLTWRLLPVIFGNAFLLVMSLGLIAGLYILKDEIPWIYATSALLYRMLLRPIYKTTDPRVSKHVTVNGEKLLTPRYDDFAPYGLIVISYAIVASRLYMMLFLTMCRIFQNAFHISARRMELCLQLESEKNTPDVRTDFVNMFKDYYSISTIVRRSNTIGGWGVATYFFIQLSGFLVESYVISRHFGTDERQYHPEAFASHVVIHGEKRFVYTTTVLFGHIIATFLSCIYVSIIAAQVYTKILEYNAVLYRRGIVGNRLPAERDFVRTLWMNCSHRNPVVISPAELFQITPQFMVQFLDVTLIYLILMFPLPLFNKYAQFDAEESLK